MNPFTKILVVEDDSTSSKLLTCHLRVMGYRNITEVKDGSLALEQMHKEKPDLVIADWHMPNLNGLDLFKAIREVALWQDILFLMVTVEKDHNKVQEAIQAGVRDYIVKPLNVENIKRKMDELLNPNSD
ncbi:MAG: response regulator [Nitrospina sp.]|nr:response regulator [Nitrospina sp.]